VAPGLDASSDTGAAVGTEDAGGAIAVDEAGAPGSVLPDGGPSCTSGSLADGLYLPAGIVADTTELYWTQQDEDRVSQIVACDKTGCQGQSPAIVVPNASNTGAVAFDTTQLFWAQPAASNVEACSKTACTPTQLVSWPDPPTLVAVDDQNVYIAAYSSLSVCSKAGCSSPTQLTPLGGPPAAIALDALDVYYADSLGDIRACAKPGCAGGPRTVVPGADAYDLKVDDSSVYFCVGAGASEPDDAGAILSCPKTGCTTPTVVAKGQNHPGALAIDASRVYWVNEGGTGLRNSGAILSCPKTGCGTGPKVHASAQALPSSIAVDQACVYWTVLGDASATPPNGSVRSARK
jgi:hypothetical protein